MTETSLREELLKTARDMNAVGINQGSSGNVSVRCGDGYLITPSGMPYDECTPEDMVMMDMSGEWSGT
ncbi:MAG: class II aldolase/adducin family protein, partial [Sneathiella sp.]|nr:class II aldolase/adducin family protein [Sneathiella sp.]